MNTYTEAETKEINDKYQAMRAKLVASLVVELNDHNDDFSHMTVGNASVTVKHKITMNREPVTEMQYSNGRDIERQIGVDYEADVNVEFVTVNFDPGICELVNFADDVMVRIVECIAKHAETQAEETDDQNAQQEFEDYMYDRAMDREHNCRDSD
ncbi:MAG TPA: hypothetical protein VIH30_11420 [Aquirhabdus sp.]